MSKFFRCINKNTGIIATVIAVVGLWVTFATLVWNAKATKDMYLTGVWNDIMQESIQHPDFTDKSKTLTYKTSFNLSTCLQYESYARWIGGYIEDLYVKEYKKNWPYYEPWVDDMFELHETWLVDNMDIYRHTREMHARLKKMKERKPNSAINTDQ